MADFSTLSLADRQAIANKDIASVSPAGLAFLQENYSTAPRASSQTQTEPVGVPDSQPSAAERFAYQFRKADTDVSNAATYLESRFPLGRISVSLSGGINYQSPEELYGPAFMEASPDVRRQVLVRAREMSLAQQYPELAAQDNLGGAAGVTGMIVGSLMSPTTLIPISKAYQGYKATAAIGAAFGAEYSALDQLAKQGEIDPVELAGAAGIGAIAAPATSAVIKALTPASRRSLLGRNIPEEKREAEESFTMIQNLVDDLSAKGVQPGAPMQEAILSYTALTPEKLDDILIKSDRKLRVHSQQTAQDILAVRAMQEGQTPMATSRGFEKILGILSTNIERISPKAHAALLKHDFNVGQETHAYRSLVKPFVDAVRKTSSNEQTALNSMMLNGDYSGIESILSRYSPDAKTHVAAIRNVFDDIASRLKNEAGYKGFEPIENYFPRIVNDYDGLLKSLDRERRTLLENALRLKAKEAGLSSVKDLPALDRAAITNSVLRGYKFNLVDGKLSFTKQRVLENILPSMEKFYAKPLDAMSIYLERATKDINTRKFFGRGNATKAARSKNLSESIGSYIDEAIQSGEMKYQDVERLRDLFDVRFGVGEQSSPKIIQNLRNIGYSTTIANPLSTLTQIGDLGMSVYVNGFKNTFASLAGKKYFNTSDLGIDDIASTELASVGSTAKFLNAALTASGFKRMDRLGKDTLINSSYRKAVNMAKSDAGIKKLRDKYGKVFEGEFASLVSDLNNGKLSDNVKLLLYSDLADVQPISLSQMPEGYLRSPSGRILYMLKTFSIKQLDVLRKDVVQNIKKGNYAEAGKNAAAYLTIMPMMGATVQETKDFLLGRGGNPEDIIKDNYIENIFKTFGSSEYVMNNYVSKGRIIPAIGEMIAPPLDWIDAIGTDIYKAQKGEFVGEESKIMAQLPGVGRLWYNFFGGGMEKAIEERAEQQRQ